jgi:anti-anti-sigma factor
MEIKINTKEKFVVVEPISNNLTDSLSLEIVNSCFKILHDDEIKNIVLNLRSIENIEQNAASNISNLQQKFYEENVSFVICEMKNNVEKNFEVLELLEFMNVTPTESEAWDIVQMEEIERELLDEE